jgi:hypothetical protein
MNVLIITLIILIPIVIGIYLSIKYYLEGLDALGWFLIIIFGAIFIVHIIACSLSKYQHDLFLQKRDAFELTLKDSRDSKKELETAAILKNVSEWNIELAEKKFDNSTFLLDCYIDDRIESVEYIE